MHFSKPVSFNGWFQQRCFLKLLMKEDPKIEAIGLSTADEASLPSEDEINRGCISIIWTPLKIQKLRDCWVFFSFFFFLKTKLFTSSKESNYSEVRNSYQRWKSPPPQNTNGILPGNGFRFNTHFRALCLLFWSSICLDLSETSEIFKILISPSLPKSQRAFITS